MILAVAAGGAIGAIGRHWISTAVQTAAGLHFPFGTLAVNVLGCAILGGLIVLMALVWSPTQEVRAFLTVGMMGALTTFSAFSVEVVLMMERGEWVHAGLYVAASVILSVGGMMLTMAGMRWVLT